MLKNDTFIIKEEFSPDKKRMLKALCILLNINYFVELDKEEKDDKGIDK